MLRSWYGLGDGLLDVATALPSFSIFFSFVRVSFAGFLGRGTSVWGILGTGFPCGPSGGATPGRRQSHHVW